MSLDKSWMRIQNRLSPEFQNGVRDFIEFAKNNVNEEGRVRCPCKYCLHTKFYPLDIVRKHIICSGIDLTYTTWSHHGEPRMPRRPREEQHVQEQPVNEMEDIVQDFVGNSGVNLDADNDADLTSLFSTLEEELYPGCTGPSTLHFIAQLLHIKVLYKWPNESVDVLLKLLLKVLPTGCKLLTSFYECKKQLKKLGLGYEVIHACPHDCCLYWKENSEMQKCPVCDTDRWKRTKGKKVPQKTLRYFSLKDRLKRLYASRQTAKLMPWHLKERSNDEDVIVNQITNKIVNYFLSASMSTS